MALQPTAFDEVATTYDSDFTESLLGQLLRQRVWQVYQRTFQAGQHLLELTCGTGADALWLAQQGLMVTATDGSPEMVALTQRKITQAGLTSMVKTAVLDVGLIGKQAMPTVVGAGPFAGVVSNFGGINTIKAWGQLAQGLAHVVQPGGKVVLVPMGPFCFWEIAWYSLHRQWPLAWRRWGQQPALAEIGSATIPVWYPSARTLRQAFAPWFTHRSTESLGLLLPPSYIGHWVAKRPSLFTRLNRWEQRLAPLTKGLGDHYIMVLERFGTADFID